MSGVALSRLLRPLYWLFSLALADGVHDLRKDVYGRYGAVD